MVQKDYVSGLWQNTVKYNTFYTRFEQFKLNVDKLKEGKSFGGTENSDEVLQDYWFVKHDMARVSYDYELAILSEQKKRAFEAFEASYRPRLQDVEEAYQEAIQELGIVASEMVDRLDPETDTTVPVIFNFPFRTVAVPEGYLNAIFRYQRTVDYLRYLNEYIENSEDTIRSLEEESNYNDVRLTLFPFRSNDTAINSKISSEWVDLEETLEQILPTSRQSYNEALYELNRLMEASGGELISPDLELSPNYESYRSVRGLQEGARELQEGLQPGAVIIDRRTGPLESGPAPQSGPAP